VTRKRYRAASPTERIYIETGTLVVSRSRIAGTVSKPQFEAAIGHLEARYSMLRSVVENGQFIERADDSSALEAWLPANICPADAVYDTLLNAGLDTRKCLYRVRVIADVDALDVFMLSSHAMTDATSLVELHSCLAYICDCVVRGVAPALETQPFPNPVDAAVSRSVASITAPGGRQAASFSGAYAEIPMPALHDGQHVRHRLERTVIDADDMHRISAAAHMQGCSVHSLLLAAFALAIGEVSSDGPRRMLMRSSVDMRRRLEPHVSPELVFSAITGHITPIPDLDRPLFDIARLVFRDIHEGVNNGSVFRDYLSYPASFGSAQQPPVALNISDMQAVNFRWPTQRLKVTGFEYACGWLKRFPNVSVSVFDGTLVANSVYVEEFVDPAMMRAISQSVVRRLIAACDALWFLR
jgi:hypothetical protein